MHIICFCAQWCRLCSAYRATFEAVASRHKAYRFAFVDIEDEADLLASVDAPDITDFPTLLIADATGLRFHGPVTPHTETLERIIRAAQTESLSPIPLGLESGALQVLLQGLAARHLYLAPGD